MSEMTGLSSSTYQEGSENRPLDTLVHEATSDHAPAGSVSPSDPASSLRAAALLTLKSKRRKPIPDQPAGFPHRPIPSGLVLNYGEEESSAPITAASPAMENTFIPPSKAVPPEAEDNREEGEISDTENTPPTVPKPKAAPKKTMKAKATSADKKSTKSSAKISPTSTKPPLHAKALATPPKQDTPLPVSLDGPSVPLAPALPVTQYGPPQAPHYVVDADHVRPGLAMNAQQFQTAKDIVIDLLGWGVEPEYITDIGVSREMIFYAFTELHLRLPRNLDTTGLVPYIPLPPRPIQVPPPVPQTQPQRSSSLSMPPPPSIPARHEASSRVTHPSLPQKPTPPANPPTSPAPRPSSTSTTQLTVLTNAYDLQLTKLTGANANLHEIEQQRKQELIARKAVQASRKNKANIANVAGPSSSSSPSPSVVSPPVVDPSMKDVDMASAVPAASVDDFLKSIGSVSDAGYETGKPDSPGIKEALPAQYRRHASPESMDVDEIPGFVTRHEDAPLSRPLSAYSQRDESVSRGGTASGGPTDPPSSTSSISGFPEAAPTETGGSDYMKEDIPPGDSNLQHSETTRRGTKRPVASDFVDFEAGPPRPYSTNGFPSGSGGSQPPSMRRKTTGSFASVSGMRRCVIDLSDSEDEGDGDLHRMEGDPHQRTFSPLPSRAVATSMSMPQMAHSGDWGFPQYHPNGNSSAQSPAALQAKEEEIKKMREMIAQKEQIRLRKLAVMSRATPTLVPPALATNSSSGQKQDDDDSSGSIAPSPTNGLSHQHFTNGHSHNITQNTAIQDVVTDGPQRKDSGSIIPISDPAASVSASGNSSASATPPIADDYISSAMENANTGEQVLTAEAQQEHVAIPKPTRPDDTPRVTVDVNDRQSSSSTQISKQVQTQDNRLQASSESFPTYNSPFDSYPLLRSHLQRIQSPTLPQYQEAEASSSSVSSVSLSSIIVSSRHFVPDLKPLKRAASFKALDPSKQICQYELPGGGVCRDEGCLDVHLSRGPDGTGVDEAEPTDADTADYLYDLLLATNDNPPQQTQERRVIVGRIADALRGLRGNGKIYEERVAEALATLSTAPPRSPF